MSVEGFGSKYNRTNNFRREALPSGLSQGIEASRVARDFSAEAILFYGVAIPILAVTSAILATSLEQGRPVKDVLGDLKGLVMKPKEESNKEEFPSSRP